MPIHPLLKKGLHKLGFTKPTEIQKQAIPMAVNGTSPTTDDQENESDQDVEMEQSEKRLRDVVGVAETVSSWSYLVTARAGTHAGLLYRVPVKPSPTLCPF